MQKDYCLTALTPLQHRLLTDMIEECRQWEPVRLEFPEDGALFLFTCEEDFPASENNFSVSENDFPTDREEKALSCIIVCQTQEDLWECYAFTRPGFRRKGLFSALLETLCRRVPEDTELVFLLDHQSPDALAALGALDMELWRREYVMECVLPGKTFFSDKPSSNNSSNSRSSSKGSSLSLTFEELNEEGLRGWLFSAFLSADCIGNCRILAYDDSHFYLYHVEIQENYRNQGWGTELIRAVIRKLPAHASLSLHVSSENKAAVKLYEKTGFHLRETLSYYLY